jgi:hypothetical protein
MPGARQRSDDEPTKVVAVLGTSFSGSTVLNLILGAHSKIYAGGEMIGLLLNRNRPIGGSCTSCGLDCEYWNADARNKVQNENLYGLTRKIFDKQIIVDTSKSVDWFKETFRLNPDVVPVYVLMVKHPIRYLASCMINIVGAVPRNRFKRVLGRFSAAFNRKAVLNEWISDLEDYYANLLLNLPRDADGAPLHILHYERLVEDQRQAITPILSSLGLDYESQLDEFYSADFHQIGGNNGAVFQVKRNWNVGDRDVPEFRRKFYEQGPAFKIDNKYASTFTVAEIEFLKSNATLQKLFDRLGYNSPQMPFAI